MPPRDVRNVVDEYAGDNFPGFEYLSRASTAAGRALTAHAQALNSAWTQMREGRYTVAAAMQTWTRLAEDYYGIATELLRGPSPLRQPAWLVIPYVKRSQQCVDFSVAIDDFLERNSTLDATAFEMFGRDRSAHNNLYAKGSPQGSGTFVQISLDRAALDDLEDSSDHVSLIFRRGAGVVTPLAVVVVHIQPRPSTTS
jgi:hypothetical protein